MAKSRPVYYVYFDILNNKTEIYDGTTVNTINGADFEQYITGKNALCFVSSVKIVEQLYPNGKVASKRLIKVNKSVDDIEYSCNGIVYRSMAALLGNNSADGLLEMYGGTSVTKAFETYLTKFNEKPEKVRYTLAKQVVDLFYSDIKDKLWRETYDEHRHIITSMQIYDDMLAANKSGMLSDVYKKYFDNMGMWDISSAYPSVMVSDDKFPIGRVISIGGNVKYKLSKLIKALKSKEWCKIVFDGKIDGFDTFYDDVVDKTALEYYDLLSCNCTKQLTDILNKIDDNTRVYICRETGYLSDIFRQKIIKLYNEKSKQKKGTFERFITKTELDMLYGKAIQTRNFTEFWQVKRYYQGRGDHYLTPEMGNHCSAKIRYIMLKAMYETCGNYCDTDGIKSPYTEENIKYFEEQNKIIMENNAKAGFPDCKIGTWDFEGKADQLLIFAPKCYVYNIDGKFEYKIAGVNVKDLKAATDKIKVNKIEYHRRYGLACGYRYIVSNKLNDKQLEYGWTYTIMDGDLM